ncbi:DNA replication protein DnaC [Draconibacterium orientale]|jgi:DNA replication protein DnaC|uniref:ATP-binding protein n=1 Tax=Draconibacterium orientale TaxID=1168034 RepID=X5DVY2_9BACT|nr:IS21-like element helper ATPase IstB [Draconibacterium orientale]AHW58750.1 ATP-binding protein [Draconibacterium orientale]AHW59000.1 ATP-binding protein [Draconibacterium orientale]AHW59350.1 ATP-binding protein [Draconibacterium orientale]SEU17321.1 DNA replication protein DnaC [Draconibacterium orientale]
MNEVTLTRMKQMKLHGMHGAFKTAIETGKTDDYTIDQFVSMITDAEWDDRNNRKIERLIKNARFHYKATIENVVYEHARNIDRTKLLRLAECDFINKNENVLISGSTGAGKSYIATALGYQACIEGYRVLYFNTTKMFSKLKMAKADGSYLKELAKMARHQLIILDDFGLQPLDSQNRIALLELIEDRHNKGSMLVTSQLPVSKWYEIIGEKTIADAILDRLIHQSHRIELMGESMRKKRNIYSE